MNIMLLKFIEYFLFSNVCDVVDLTCVKRAFIPSFSMPVSVIT